MNPTCILFVKAAIALSPMVGLSTEPPSSYSALMSPADVMRSQATAIDTKDKAIVLFRTDLAACLKASPEILK